MEITNQQASLYTGQHLTLTNSTESRSNFSQDEELISILFPEFLGIGLEPLDTVSK